MGIWNQKAVSSQVSDPAPSGTHPAVLVGLIDLGTHEENYKDSGNVRDVRKVYLIWELTSEPCPGLSRNWTIGKMFSLSFGKKSALRQFIERWKGSGFAENEEYDVTKLLGKKCLLTVTHDTKNENTYAKVESVSPPVKGMDTPEAKIKPLLYQLDSGQPPPADPWIPYLYGKSVKDVIESSHEKRGKAPAQQPDRQPAGASAGADEDRF